jgi:hypothetical protein
MNIHSYNTKEEILNISVNQAYQWIKTGHWSLREFNLWDKTRHLNSYTEGFNTGYEASEKENEPMNKCSV